MSLPVVCCVVVPLFVSLGTVECWGGRQGGYGLELCGKPTQGVWQPAGCVSCELVCVCVSLVRVVIICPASTHTALVSSPSLAVLHLSTYLPCFIPLKVSKSRYISSRSGGTFFWLGQLFSHI